MAVWRDSVPLPLTGDCLPFVGRVKDVWSCTDAQAQRWCVCGGSSQREAQSQCCPCKPHAHVPLVTVSAEGGEGTPQDPRPQPVVDGSHGGWRRRRAGGGRRGVARAPDLWASSGAYDTVFAIAGSAQGNSTRRTL